MKILVLGDGDSPEREVSLRSAKAAAVAGMSMPQLIKRFADMVVRDYSI